MHEAASRPSPSSKLESIGRLAALGAVLLFAPAGPPAAFAAEPGFENPGKVAADRYLRPEEMAGADWKVAPEATSDGLFNTYTVESRFGSFTARGRIQLGLRGKEVEALSELEKVSKSKVFVDSVASAAVAPVKVVVNFAQEPMETVQGIGGGVKRLWGKTKFQVAEGTHDAKEVVQGGDEKEAGSAGSGKSTTEKGKEAASDYAKKYLGTSAAERRWYADLGVDPYTDNAPLRKAVKEVSRVEAAAKFGLRFAGLPSIPGAREVGKVMDLVWKTDPVELRKMNRDFLLGAGLSQETARQFEDNPALSPTMQTALIQSAKLLEGVAGRKYLIERAIDVDDAIAARMLVTSTALLTRYHSQVAPLAEILPGARLPVARGRDGRLVAVATVDAAFWTADVAEGAREFAALYAGEKSSKRELRVAGEASERFKSEARALGWEVLDRWQLAAPEDRAPAAPAKAPGR